jgi:hypothetical protein
MQVRLWMQVWRVLFVGREDLKQPFLGECDLNTKTIRVLKTLHGRERLDTLIHEMLHAVLPNKSERWVNQVATDISDVLWKNGYRNVREEKPPK